MITRYTPIQQMLDEFSKDRDRARYWQQKMAARNYRLTERDAVFSAMSNKSKDNRGCLTEYDSPTYCNKWILWWRYISRGYGVFPEVKDYQVMYRMTEAYMDILVPTVIHNEQGLMRGVTLFTDHLFQRIHMRLGVDMSDRKKVIQNFVEMVMCCVLDIRDPRPGEKDMQVIQRLPMSWMRGHIIYCGDTYLIRFNTFYTDKDLTAGQRRYLKSFAKFADAFETKGEIKKYFSQREDSYWEEFINKKE